jgi:REP element-mobilizing transposase RayT
MPSGRAFVILDRELDAATTGPLWLKVPSVADCVSRVLLAGASQWGLYDLTAWVVMANHIHLLLQPLLPLSRALMNIKSASARVANALLHRARRPFWQDESYDHWVRSEEERRRIIRYIERNPVKAGLVPAPEAWPWSSAGGQGMALPHSE